MSEEKYYTAKEASSILFISAQIIRIYCRKGVFPGAELERGTRWKIPSSDIQAMLNGDIDVKGIFKNWRKSK